VKPATIADLHITTKEIERRAWKKGIKVTYMEGLDTPYATKDSIVLPVLKDPITTEELDYHRYKVLHELGHHDRDEAFDIMVRVGEPPATFMFTWNIVEDEALETEAAHRYHGDRLTIENGRSYHVHGMNAKVAADRAMAPPGIKVKGDSLKQAALYVTALRSRRGWHRGVEALADAVLHVIPEATELADKLETEGWVDLMAMPMNVPAAYEFSRELHMRLWPESKTPPPNEELVPENKASGKPEGEGEAQQNAGEEGEGEQGDSGAAEAEAQQSKGEGEEAEGPSLVIPWEVLVNNDHKNMKDAPDTKKGKERISYVGWTSSTGTFYPHDRVKVVEKPVGRMRWPYNPSDLASIANQLRRHIQAQTRSSWESDRPTGRVNKRALKRVVMGTRDYHRRIFQKRTDAVAVDTAISVLVDCSGSMSGPSIQYAATAAASLAEVFGRVLKCKVEVLGHTTASSDNGECPMLAVAKSFAAPATPEEVYTRLCGVRMRGNADGDALMFAAHRLAQRPEARKILILLADGQPTDAYMGDPASVMVMAIDTIERMGIHTAGIGIMHEGIRHFFEDAEVIESPDQVGRAVLKTAERFVLKN